MATKFVQVYGSLTSNIMISEYRSHDDLPIKYRFQSSLNSIWINENLEKTRIKITSMQDLT